MHPDTDKLSRQLAEDEDSATQASFVQLCRRSPAFRRWLWSDFATNAALRAKVARVIADKSAPAVNGMHWFAALAEEDRAWRQEQQRLQSAMSHLVRPYGGLARLEVEKLIRIHQAGTLDLGAFLLVHAWREAGSEAISSPVLTRAAATFVDTVVCGGEARLLRHFAKALRFLDRCESKTKRRAALGHADRWKLQVLFYMLRHPRESYRIRDFRAFLLERGVRVQAKDIRRFCSQHGIRRDMRAGRPRARAAGAAAEPKSPLTLPLRHT